MIEKIDCLIGTLKIIKLELEYNEKYQKAYEEDEKKGILWEFGSKTYHMRRPNKIMIREALKTVCRISSILAKEV